MKILLLGILFGGCFLASQGFTKNTCFRNRQLHRLIAGTVSYATSTTDTINDNNERTIVNDDGTEDDDDDDDNKKIALGFLGCGTIASAIVRGVESHPSIRQISVTRRSESKSAVLVKEFGRDRVTVFDSAQDVVDCSDVCFLCVLPDQVQNTLQSLSFDPERHLLVSLVSTATLSELQLHSNLPADSVSKMICLPAVAHREGVSIIAPKRTRGYDRAPTTATRRYPILLDLLSHTGGYVEAETENEMRTMMIPSGMMGPLYNVMRTNRDWLVRHGVRVSDAEYLVTKYYASMAFDARRRLDNNNDNNNMDKTVPSSSSSSSSSRVLLLDELIDEQTPAGLNEQALRNLEDLGVPEAYDRASDALLRRLLGQSDGSLE